MIRGPGLDTIFGSMEVTLFSCIARIVSHPALFWMVVVSPYMETITSGFHFTTCSDETWGQPFKSFATLSPPAILVNSFNRVPLPAVNKDGSDSNQTFTALSFFTAAT